MVDETEFGCMGADDEARLDDDDEQDCTTSKTFEFTVHLVGKGETEEEAWADATEAFNQDPGEPANVDEII